MEENILEEILKICIIPVVSNGFGRKLMFFNAGVGVVILLIQTTYFLSKFDGSILKMYGPAFFLSVHGTSVLCMCLYCRDKVVNLLDIKRKTFCAVNLGGKILEKKIAKEVLITLFLFRATIMVLVMIVISLMASINKMDRMFIPFKLVNETVSNKYICLGINILQILWISFCTFCSLSVYIFNYFVISFRFQLYLFHDHLHKLYRHEEENQVHRLLTLAVKRHTELKRYAKLIQELSVTFLLIYGVTGVINNFTYLIVFLTGTLEAPKIIFILLALVVYLIALVSTVSGQAFEDNFEEIHLLICKAPWYEWNEKSKKVFLVFLANSIQPVKIYLTKEICINYLLLIQIYRIVFAGANMVYTLSYK